jgi:hypothetical protein
MKAYLQGGIVVALPQLLTWRYFPQSPKYLYIQKRDEKGALESILFYHGTTEYAGRHEYDF